MNPTIKTNNVPRDVIDAWELTEKERKEFDWLDWSAIEEKSYRWSLHLLRKGKNE